MRLAKFLAHAGVASRRAAEQIVADGRVTVGGEVVTDPARDVDDASGVAVDGHRVETEPLEVHALNKPAGVVSTARDTHGRPTVVQLVRSRRRLYPVGRLDAETTGLILLTNDGELAERLTHPRYGVKKVYRARVQPARLSPRAIEALRGGVELEDGRTAPADVRQPASGVLELTIREGRKRQVRRMIEAVGHRVVELERVAFGPLGLRGLETGKSRRLTKAEVERLRRVAEPRSGRAGRAPRGRAKPGGAKPGGAKPGAPRPAGAKPRARTQQPGAKPRARAERPGAMQAGGKSRARAERPGAMQAGAKSRARAERPGAKPAGGKSRARTERPGAKPGGKPPARPPRPRKPRPRRAQG